eukprot:14986363-Alexandrium_andersonii.AAC.1
MRDSCRRGAAWSRDRRRHASRCIWRRRCPDGRAPRDAMDAGARLCDGTPRRPRKDHRPGPRTLTVRREPKGRGPR